VTRICVSGSRSFEKVKFPSPRAQDFDLSLALDAPMSPSLEAFCCRFRHRVIALTVAMVSLMFSVTFSSCYSEFLRCTLAISSKFTSEAMSSLPTSVIEDDRCHQDLELNAISGLPCFTMPDLVTLPDDTYHVRTIISTPHARRQVGQEYHQYYDVTTTQTHFAISLDLAISMEELVTHYPRLIFEDQTHPTLFHEPSIDFVGQHLVPPVFEDNHHIKTIEFCCQSLRGWEHDKREGAEGLCYHSR